MFEKLDKKVDEELLAQIEAISSMQTGSNEKSKAIDDFAKLYGLAHNDVECERAHLISESQNEEAAKEHDTALNEQKKDRYVKIGIAAAELVIPMIFYGIWLRKGLKFEETGSFTSTTFKGFINRFKPAK